METYGERAKEILNELHTERLDYESEYLPLIDCALQCAAYEDTGFRPGDIKELCSDDVAKVAKMLRQLIEHGEVDHLLELLEAEKNGRLVVLPKVSEADGKLFTDNLKDVFDDWANYDPSVGIFGMSDGEAALANALMCGLKSI